jgi:hypothetical protein
MFSCPYCSGVKIPGVLDRSAHEVTCPFATGVFPVTVDDLFPDGLRCGGCGESFVDGDSYTHVRSQDEVNMYVVVCLGCAAFHELAIT